MFQPSPHDTHLAAAEALSTHTPDIKDKGGTGVPGLVHFA